MPLLPRLALAGCLFAATAAPALAFDAKEKEEIGKIVREYIIQNPDVLYEAQKEWNRRQEAETEKKRVVALKDYLAKIDRSGLHATIGNPNGDVTLVEFFDYNCGYCRSALPDLATLLAEDPDLRVILKEFPILSNESIDAARVAVLVGEADADYWSFHEALFTSRGKVDKQVALAAAADLGLSPVSLELDMGKDSVSKTIQTSYEIAKALNITGTPTYIIGNEVIPGAIGIEELRQRIANMRACGQSLCDS